MPGDLMVTTKMADSLRIEGASTPLSVPYKNLIRSPNGDSLEYTTSIRVLNNTTEAGGFLN